MTDASVRCTTKAIVLSTVSNFPFILQEELHTVKLSSRGTKVITTSELVSFNNKEFQEFSGEFHKRLQLSTKRFQEVL